jgi:hypothetical protein
VWWSGVAGTEDNKKSEKKNLEVNGDMRHGFTDIFI